MPYLYDSISLRYLGYREEMYPGEPIVDCTMVPPPPRVKQTIIKWDPLIKNWYYAEWLPAPGEDDIMDNILTYSHLRVLEYPSKEEYLDAIVKNDQNQLNAYIQECLKVKEKWPKDVRLTQRAYFQQKYGMRS